jgi:DNA-binding LacI/PurR family transcriptional regulator
MLGTGTKTAPTRSSRTTTGRDVAALAGVSPSAVSLVLNGGGRRHGLSQATEARVLSAAAALDYVPNQAARSLRRRRTNVVTFMTSELGNPYFAEVAAAAQLAALARGYVLDIIAADGEAAELDALARLRGGGTSDGLVIHGGSARVGAELRQLARRGIGCVVVQDSVVQDSVVQDSGEDPGIPCVRVDLQAGARLATRHLIGLGHRRIAHVTDARLAGAARNDRLSGYRQALAEAGLPADPDLLAPGENSLAGGEAAMRALLARPGLRPTAVFVFNDQMAVGGLHALRRLGLAVPEDIAVVGFDGIALGAYTTPALTTVDHPRQELGRLAAETLLDLLQGGRPEAAPRTLPVRLVVRQSCGAAT